MDKTRNSQNRERGRQLRYFRSTTIHDMKYDVKAILKKEPDFIIIFVGTSNTAI